MASKGLRFLGLLMLGHEDLAWSQDEAEERAAWWRMAAAHECGWVGEPTNGPAQAFGWEVYDTGGGTLGARGTAALLLDESEADVDRDHPWVGVGRDGLVLEVNRGELLDSSGASITVPDDGTWRTLLAKASTTQLAPGTLALTSGSTTVVGTGTRFTRYQVSGGPGSGVGATRIRIDPADTSSGNEGSYTIASITDDEHMELTAAPPATEAGVRFRVRGTFFRTDPADPDSRSETAVAWSLVTRTTTRPTDGSLVVADVMRTAGVLSVIDRRRANVWTPKDGRATSYALSPVLEAHNAAAAGATNTAEFVFLESWAPSATHVDDVPAGAAMAPAATGGGDAPFSPTPEPVGALWLLATNNATTSVNRVLAVPWHAARRVQYRMDDLGGGIVTVYSGAEDVADVALVALPNGGANTHAALVVRDGNLYRYFSTDNGATWAAGTVIYSGANVTRVAAVLTRMGRLVVVTLHSASAYLRTMHSDDLGATWTGSGTSLTVGNAKTVDVAVAEDDRGNLWIVEGRDETADSPLYVHRGGAEGDPIPVGSGSGGSGTGWPIGPAYDAHPYAGRSVEAVAMPNGHVVAVANLRADIGVGNTFAETYTVVVARRRPVSTTVWVKNTDADNDPAIACPVACTVLANGELLASQVVMEAGVKPKAVVLRLVPAVTHRNGSVLPWS